MRRLLIVSCCLSLVACDWMRPGAENAAESDATAAPTANEQLPSVDALDELRALPAPPVDVAFWRHPTLPFNSLAVVATEAGLAAYNIEDAAPTTVVEDAGLTALTIGYLGLGEAATGLLIGADAVDGLRFYTIDNLERSLALTPNLIALSSTPEAICAGRASPMGGDPTSDDISLTTFAAGQMTTYRLVLSDAGVSASETMSRAAPAGIIDCTVDDRTGDVFAVVRDGSVFKLTGSVSQSNDGAAPFALANIIDAVSIAVSLHEASGDDAASGDTVIVANGADGSLHFFDRATGEALGTGAVSASFDVEGVTEARAMALGYGNYGGPFRDGALAFVTPEPSGSVRIAPLNGLLRALSIDFGAPASPRLRFDEADQDGLSFDLKAIAP
ncbi:MAG: hypothetical protein AAF850_09920 [Pseudomonadota bacterium]